MIRHYTHKDAEGQYAIEVYGTLPFVYLNKKVRGHWMGAKPIAPASSEYQSLPPFWRTYCDRFWQKD